MFGLKNNTLKILSWRHCSDIPSVTQVSRCIIKAEGLKITFSWKPETVKTCGAASRLTRPFFGQFIIHTSHIMWQSTSPGSLGRPYFKSLLHCFFLMKHWFTQCVKLRLRVPSSQRVTAADTPACTDYSLERKYFTRRPHSILASKQPQTELPVIGPMLFLPKSPVSALQKMQNISGES